MQLQQSYGQQEVAGHVERIAELEQELDDVRTQEEFLRSRLAIFECTSYGSSDTARGNTLLSEVDDKRRKSEKQHAEMLALHRRLVKEIQQLKRANKEMKVQLASSTASVSESQFKDQIAAIANLMSGLQNGAPTPTASINHADDDLPLTPDSFFLLKLELEQQRMQNDALRQENQSLRIIGLNEMGKFQKVSYSMSQQGKKVQEAESTISHLKEKLTVSTESACNIKQQEADIEGEASADLDLEGEPSSQVHEEDSKENSQLQSDITISLPKSVGPTQPVSKRREKAVLQSRQVKQVNVKDNEAKTGDCHTQ
ncbi:hypothetical protein BC830DRAFT_378915 [Chytriomyces sp. MP71]|nr:hypothetical protein BC830DRAFT_378915 [Chytriomyces sp. MP71]